MMASVLCMEVSTGAECTGAGVGAGVGAEVEASEGALALALWDPGNAIFGSSGSSSYS